MAVAMEVAWRGGVELGGGAGMSGSGTSSKKRAWGADTEKLMQLMMGQFGSKLENKEAEKEEMTLDLLGVGRRTSGGAHELGCTSGSEFLELDPDQPLPSNWEKCLDLKTGGVYFVNKSTGARTTEDPRKECHPRLTSEAPTTSSPTPLEFLGSKMSETLREESQRVSTSSTGKQLWNLQLDDHLELNLNLSPGRGSPTRQCQSVCTMEMVERALQHTKKMPTHAPKLSTSSSFSSLTSVRSDSHSTSSSSSEAESGTTATTTLVMGACTRCLMYVMLHKSDPKCPRCESDVPLDFTTSPPPSKRLRVDTQSP